MADPTAAPNPYQAPQPAAPLNPHEEKQFALLTHLLSIFFGFIPALIFFTLYKDRGPFVRNHVVTEWNFQLTALIGQGVGLAIAIIGWVTTFATLSSAPHDVPTGVPGGFIAFGVGYVINLVVIVIRIVFDIIASVAANRGRFYRHRLAIRFVKE